jgi:5-methylcytosine-specific restriction endonuclease McrA
MNCLNCNTPISNKWGRKFCSVECRLKHWRKLNPEKVQAHHEKDHEASVARSLKRYYDVLRSDPKEAERQRQKAKLRKKKLRSLPKDFTSKDWKAALEYFEHRCAYCGQPASKLEQEHFIPVKAGGGFTKKNIIPACSKCNSKKRAKNTIDWIAGLPNALVAYARIIKYLGT